MGGGAAALIAWVEFRHLRATSPDDVAIQLAYARRVVVVPGYGMAVAQAQHAVRELAERSRRAGWTCATPSTPWPGGCRAT